VRRDKETGIITIFDPDLPHEVELPTFTCPHCGGVGRITSRMGRTFGSVYSEPMLDPSRGSPQDDGGWCLACGAMICRQQACADHDPMLHPRFAHLGFGW
jgi:predicted RNA-binding Zn-ribbon protein involved in translation (DUF1610 family)